jgi:hypothetical protein
VLKGHGDDDDGGAGDEGPDEEADLADARRRRLGRLARAVVVIAGAGAVVGEERGLFGYLRERDDALD